MTTPTFDHATLIEEDRSQLHPLHHPSRHGDPLMVTEADGVYLYTSDGRKILDGMAGLWNVNVGYGNQELPRVAYEQMQKMPYTSGFAGSSNPPSARLAAKMAGLAHPQLNTTHFTSSGSEATDTSIKTARFFWRQLGQPQKTKIISRYYAYHGITLGATSATGMSKYHTMFGELLPGFMHIPNPNPYNYEGDRREGESVGQAAARALEEAILREGPDTVAAFIAETIQGAGGVIIPPDDYFPLVQEICRKYDVLLIIDEVICGFGRTGKMFAIQHYGIDPDIMQFAKGVTSGYVPLGGIQISDAVRDVIMKAPAEQSWMHGHTYSGHATACAVAVANIDIIEREGLVENSRQMGQRLLEGLESLTDFPNIDNARGKGLLAAVDVVVDKESHQWDPATAMAVFKEARSRGLLTRPLGGTMAFSPPLTISAGEVDAIVDILGQSIAAASSR